MKCARQSKHHFIRPVLTEQPPALRGSANEVDHDVTNVTYWVCISISGGRSHLEALLSMRLAEQRLKHYEN